MCHRLGIVAKLVKDGLNAKCNVEQELCSSLIWNGIVQKMIVQQLQSLRVQKVPIVERQEYATNVGDPWKLNCGNSAAYLCQFRAWQNNMQAALNHHQCRLQSTDCTYSWAAPRPLQSILNIRELHGQGLLYATKLPEISIRHLRNTLSRISWTNELVAALHANFFSQKPLQPYKGSIKHQVRKNAF